MRVGCNVEVSATYHRARGRERAVVKGRCFQVANERFNPQHGNPDDESTATRQKAQRELRGMRQFLSTIMPSRQSGTGRDRERSKWLHDDPVSPSRNKTELQSHPTSIPQLPQ